MPSGKSPAAGSAKPKATSISAKQPAAVTTARAPAPASVNPAEATNQPRFGRPPKRERESPYVCHEGSCRGRLRHHCKHGRPGSDAGSTASTPSFSRPSRAINPDMWLGTLKEIASMQDDNLKMKVLAVVDKHHYAFFGTPIEDSSSDESSSSDGPRTPRP